MAPRLRAPAVFAEDVVLSLRTHILVHNYNSSSRGPSVLF